MAAEDSYPRLAARTRSFTLGRPRSVQVSPDGRQVLFLRSRSGTDPVRCLWRLDVDSGTEHVVADPGDLLLGTGESLTRQERARRERLREAGGGIVDYALDDAGRVAAFALSGRLFTADLLTGEVAEVVVAGPVSDPRPAPDGRHVGYVAEGVLRIADLFAGDRVLAAEDGVTWGLAEFIAAEELRRHRGYWWAPDSTAILAARVDEAPVQRWHIADPANPDRPAVEVAYPRAGTPNADVSLAIFRLDGSRVDVEWDRDRFPYLVTVHWSAAGPPLLSVLTRDQRCMRVLVLDADTGGCTVLREETDPHWVEVITGVPAWGPGGRLVWTVDQEGARRLLVDGEVLTPAALNVRRVVEVTDRGVYLAASAADPADIDTYLVTWEGEISAVTDGGCNSVAVGGPDTMVRLHAGMECFGTQVTVDHAGSRREVTSCAQEPPVVPEVSLLWAGARRLRTGLVLPRGHTPGTPLPVLLDPYGGPHVQEVLSARDMWLESQWFADQGFAVVVTDGRGTPGRGTEWERAVAGDLATAPIEDQVDALHAVAAEQPDLDLSRVAIRGWSFGGFLAAAALLRRPDVFRAAIAGAPVTDQSMYDTAYTERYLGCDTSAESYRVSSLIDDAPNLRGELLIIHGLADDNVVVAHSLRLSAALLAAGRPHSLLPLTGVTHMTHHEAVAESLLLLQVDFLRRALS